MDCKECAEDLTAFLDGELDRAGAERIRSHLAACKSCSEELRGLRATVDFVESHNRVLEPRTGSWNLVRARIAAESAPSPSRSRLWNWRFALASLAVLAAFALAYLQYQQTRTKDLDRYMFQYVQQREAQIKAYSVAAGAGIQSLAGNPYASNPFIEVEATVADNPFRSEGR